MGLEAGEHHAAPHVIESSLAATSLLAELSSLQWSWALAGGLLMEAFAGSRAMAWEWAARRASWHSCQRALIPFSAFPRIKVWRDSSYGKRFRKFQPNASTEAANPDRAVRDGSGTGYAVAAGSSVSHLRYCRKADARSELALRPTEGNMYSLQQAIFMQGIGIPVPKAVGTVIYGWGQYKDEVDQLPRAEQDKIDQAADLIVSSFAQFALPPFRSVTIIGHADKDWHGTELEGKVSVQRARAVQKALTEKVLALWRNRNMGPTPPGGVEWELDGKGATEMIAPAYHAQNRRVVIELIRNGAPIPPPPAPATLQQRVDRLLRLLESRKLPGDGAGTRTSRAKCMLSKLTKPGVIDVFVDGSIANETINGSTPKPEECLVYGRNAGWLGNYDGTKKPMPQSEFMKFLGSVTPIINGPGFASDQTDDHMLEVLAVLIRNIEDGMNMVDNYIVRMGMMSDPIVQKLLKIDGFAGDVARKKLQSLYRNNLDDASNIYSCWA